MDIFEYCFVRPAHGIGQNDDLLESEIVRFFGKRPLPRPVTIRFYHWHQAFQRTVWQEGYGIPSQIKVPSFQIPT